VVPLRVLLYEKQAVSDRVSITVQRLSIERALTEVCLVFIVEFGYLDVFHVQKR
jgi:hypothetical protein